MSDFTRREVVKVSPELDAALVVLVYLLIGTVGLVNLWLITRVVTGSKVQEHKVELTSKSEDNIYTQLSARESVKAAEANEHAAKLALETAKVNQHTEETRLERARLEKSG